MPIRNKDGTVYQLRGPNPLLREQTDWDQTKVSLINCHWKDEVVEDMRGPVKEEAKLYRDIGDELNLKPKPKVVTIPAKQFIQEAKQEPPSPPEPDPTPEPEITHVAEKLDEPVEINVDPRLARVLKERGVEYFCAPVMGHKKHVDDFYGNSYTTPIFGDQYLFDAIVIDQSDLQLQFWCVKPITKDSVVYRKVKDGGERWWRVQEVQPKTGGYLAKAVTSDLNPDFSG